MNHFIIHIGGGCEEEEEEFITSGDWRGKHNSLSRGRREGSNLIILKR